MSEGTKKRRGTNPKAVLYDVYFESHCSFKYGQETHVCPLWT